MKTPAVPSEPVRDTTGGSDAGQPQPDPCATAPLRKPSAMRLPEQVQRQTGQGPRPAGRGWSTRQGGQPQKDAERRAGKSRKVH